MTSALSAERLKEIQQHHQRGEICGYGRNDAYRLSRIAVTDLLAEVSRLTADLASAVAEREKAEKEAASLKEALGTGELLPALVVAIHARKAAEASLASAVAERERELKEATTDGGATIHADLSRMLADERDGDVHTLVDRLLWALSVVTAGGKRKDAQIAQLEASLAAAAVAEIEGALSPLQTPAPDLESTPKETA